LKVFVNNKKIKIIMESGVYGESQQLQEHEDESCCSLCANVSSLAEQIAEHLKNHHHGKKTPK
jgi:hypothetical protein